LEFLKFPTTAKGLDELGGWLASFGTVEAVGVEGTSSYGAELTRQLTYKGTRVIEVPRPNRAQRRRIGKSDPIDAEAAARAVLADQARVAPKLGTSAIESIRVLTVARHGAIKSRVAGVNSLKSLIVTASSGVRDQLVQGDTKKLVASCAALHITSEELIDPVYGTKFALKSIATRILALEAEIKSIDARLEELVLWAAPNTLSVFGLGTNAVAALLIAIGDNPERLKSESCFARLCGVAPIPASSGKVHRHRLHLRRCTSGECCLAYGGHRPPPVLRENQGLYGTANPTGALKNGGH
jgi:transposase